MIRFFTLIALFYIHWLYANIPSPTEMRKKFYLSVESHVAAKNFLKELENVKNAEPLVLGYKAAVNMVMAKHVFNPYSKFKYFMEGKATLEKAIAADTNNTELRLIRFAIQNNAPGFLGYQDHLQADKKCLISALSSNLKDDEFKKIIKNYLLESKYTTPNEKEWIKKV